LASSKEEANYRTPAPATSGGGQPAHLLQRLLGQEEEAAKKHVQAT